MNDQGFLQSFGRRNMTTKAITLPIEITCRAKIIQPCFPYRNDSGVTAVLYQ
jgi:hypothetical protein